MTQALATIIGILSISFLFIYISMKLKEENKPLRLLFLCVGIFNIWISIMILKEILQEYISGIAADNIFNLLDTIYKATMYVGIFFIVIIFLVFLMNIIKGFLSKKEEDDINNM